VKPVQEPTRIIAIRHGETAWNVDTRIQGQLDISLNAKGRWQAAQAARALASESIDAIYSSDLLRAWATAMAVAETASRSVVTRSGLRERGFGAFEGKTFAEIALLWPEQSQAWRTREPGFAPEGGESLIDFRARIVGEVTALASQHQGQQIVLVAHGGVMDVLYRAATRQEIQAPRTWDLGNANINRLLWTPQGLSIVGWGDNAHLEGVLDDSAA
jgi:2,3-bisphosphoglycerate-dependent phosphoglycerate mutase